MDVSRLLSEVRLYRLEVSEYKQKNDDMGRTLLSLNETINLKLEEFDRKQCARDDENINLLRESFFQLQIGINFTDQLNMRSELELAGIPEQTEENLCHIAMITASHIGVELTESDIDDVYRVGPRRRHHIIEKPRSIVLRLVRRAKRSDILRAAKSKRPLSSEVIVPGTSAKVYINERLTKNNRQLFREARMRAHMYGFQFCWIRNGNIFVRKAADMPPIPIRTSDDLDEKIGTIEIVDT